MPLTHEWPVAGSRNYVTETQAIERIRVISDETISSALLGYPSTQWEVAEIASIERFLADRRNRLRELMNRASVIIPALQEERL